jgi:hypothetical protein
MPVLRRLLLVSLFVSVAAGPLGERASAALAAQASRGSDVLMVRAAVGVLAIEGLRLLCTACISRAASAVERIPGVAEVGRVPNRIPPVVIVRFDPAHVSTETVLQAFKGGLEGDPASPGPVTIELVQGPVSAPPVLDPIERTDTRCPFC